MQAISQQTITLDCLGLKNTAKLEVRKIVKQYFERLQKAYKNCQGIKVRILKLAPENVAAKARNKYLVIINLTISKNEEIFIVRQSKPTAKSESVIFALTAAFAMLYRKLIETQFAL